jgi:hypothetical protein
MIEQFQDCEEFDKLLDAYETSEGANVALEFKKIDDHIKHCKICQSNDEEMKKEDEDILKYPKEGDMLSCFCEHVNPLGISFDSKSYKLYRRVIRRKTFLRRAKELNAPGVLISIQERMVRESELALFEAPIQDQDLVNLLRVSEALT